MPNNTGTGFKDLLVPIGTLIGAALGFGGAITAARLAAQAQDRRTRQEQENKRLDEERTRQVRRLESFADQAHESIGPVIQLTRFSERHWNEQDAMSARLALRLNVAQLLGASRILPVVGLDNSAQKFTAAALAVGTANMATSARPLIEHCGNAYNDLLQTVSKALTESTTTS